MDAVAANTALMNRIYRRQRHVYDATRKFYLLGRDQLIARLDARAGDRILEIGCGTGRNLILTAERYPQTRLFGVDVSTVMLTSAIDQVARAGLSARIRVAHADATTLDPKLLFGEAAFERIFISYSISMIPRWEEALERALSLLASGGELHIVDFGGQRRLPRWFRHGLRRWLALFHVSPRDSLESWLRRRCAALGATLLFKRPCRDYAQHAVLRR